MRRVRAAFVAIAATGLAAGCHAGAGPSDVASAATAAAGEPTTPTAADRAARALAQAHRAAERGETDALRDALGVIERLAVQPGSEVERDTLDGWRRLAQFEETPFRGSALGPAFRKGTLGPGARMDIGQTFLAGQRAQLAVEASGSGALGIEVLDSSEKSVCARNGARVTCSWLPLFTERHSIRLSNRSDRRLTYYLVIE